MKWDLTAPQPGDAVRVAVGRIYHYGIYSGADEVIQFGLAPSARLQLKQSEVEVLASTVADFTQGGAMERGRVEASDGAPRAPSEVVAFARTRLGERGYNLIHNNCEHFVYECMFGEKRSTQTDGVRAMFASMPVVDVYVARLPRGNTQSPLGVATRQAELDAVGNPAVREEKYFVWRLLEYALMRSLGLVANALSFTRTEQGKWLCDKCFFSLSHSKNALAVAVSRQPVGVDIERLSPQKTAVIERVLTEAERSALAQSEDGWQNLIFAWSKKESLFKKGGAGSFAPSRIETLGESIWERAVQIDGEMYALTVATDTPDRVRCYENVPLRDGE